MGYRPGPRLRLAAYAHQALIIGPYSPDLADLVRKAAGILQSNVGAGRIPSDGFLLLASVPFAEIGVDRARRTQVTLPVQLRSRSHHARVSACALTNPTPSISPTRKMMAFLLFVPDPRHVLMVGLGGGSLAKFCHRHLPRARLTVVEVDPDVIALRNEFAIPDDPRLAIVQADAADYLPAAEGDTDVQLLDGFDCKGIAPAFLSRGFYRMARRRLRPGGLLVANFAGPRKYWSRHLDFLNEAFEGQVQLGTVAGGDNHIAFAFDAAGCAIDWQQLEVRAALLADQFPLDFPAIVASLREGAELRWAKAASAKALPIQQTKESHLCTKSTPT